MLAEAVDVWVCGEVGLDADVLGLKDQGVTFGGEEDLVRVGPEDREGKGAGGVLELDLG